MLSMTLDDLELLEVQFVAEIRQKTVMSLFKRIRKGAPLVTRYRPRALTFALARLSCNESVVNVYS